MFGSFIVLALKIYREMSGTVICQSLRAKLNMPRLLTQQHLYGSMPRGAQWLQRRLWICPAAPQQHHAAFRPASNHIWDVAYSVSGQNLHIQKRVILAHSWDTVIQCAENDYLFDPVSPVLRLGESERDPNNGLFEEKPSRCKVYGFDLEPKRVLLSRM